VTHGADIKSKGQRSGLSNNVNCNQQWQCIRLHHYYNSL